MNDSSDSFFQTLEGLKANSPEATQRVWADFHHLMVRYADQKLGGLPRRSADEDDVALSAMHSFYKGMQAGRFPDVSSNDDLLKILFVITDRKAKKEIRRQMTLKRGGGAVRGESVFLQLGDETAGLNNLPENGTPFDLAHRLSIECQELLAMLNDDMLRKVALLKLQGYSTGEIAETLGVVNRTIERKLDMIRKQWEKALNVHNDADQHDEIHEN